MRGQIADSTTGPEATSTNVPKLGWIFWVRRGDITALSLACLMAFQTFGLMLTAKPSSAWISFGEKFVVSPAMAGIAAIGAASIGAFALKRQLDHTKSESFRTQEKDAEEAWWEKFEWVTDRILPIDPNHMKLERSLAIDLLTSLMTMATAEFQKSAVSGVMEHYLKPVSGSNLVDHDPDIRTETEAKSVREFIKASEAASVIVGAAQGALGAYDYEIAIEDALFERDIEIDTLRQYPDPAALGSDRSLRPGAVVQLGSSKVVLETKVWDKFKIPMAEAAVTKLRAMKAVVGASHAVLITQADIPAQVQELPVRADGVRFVQWSPTDGSAVLERRLREVIAL